MAGFPRADGVIEEMLFQREIDTHPMLLGLIAPNRCPLSLNREPWFPRSDGQPSANWEFQDWPSGVMGNRLSEGVHSGRVPHVYAERGPADDGWAITLPPRRFSTSASTWFAHRSSQVRYSSGRLLIT